MALGICCSFDEATLSKCGWDTMRAYEDADLDSLIEIMRVHLGPYVVAHIGPWAQSETMLREEIPAASDDISVVTDGAQIIAFVWITLEPEWLLLEEIHVVEAARARGLGRKLMAFVEAQAERSRRSKIRLTVFAESPAVQFYARLGYTVVDETPARAQLHMEKILPPEDPHGARPDPF